MIVWSTLEASCPICRNRTRLREVGSGFIVGQDSDLLVRMASKHIIQAEVHTCHKCRFSGYSRDFLRTISPTQSRRFLDEVSPTLCDEQAFEPGGAQGQARTPLPHIQYQWAARTAQLLGLSASEEGERWLRAYWCLRLPPSSYLPPALQQSLKKLYMKWAILKLREGLRADRERNRLYLIGELCRRNGNFLMAASHLKRFLELDGGADYLRTAARKLIEAARQRISRELTMEEVLYGSEPDRQRRSEGGTIV